MIIGTGVDIVQVERFRKNHSTRFLQRVFSAYEQAYLSTKGAESMAGLFAAKEAVVKALGTGFSGFSPCDIEIMHKKSGKPYVRLHGRAKEVLKEWLGSHIQTVTVSNRLNSMLGNSSPISLQSLVRLRRTATPVGKKAARKTFVSLTAPNAAEPLSCATLHKLRKAKMRCVLHLSISHTNADAIAFAVLSLRRSLP